VRVAYGLPAVTSFSDITSNVTVQQELQATYGTVDNIDPFEGMLAEDHLLGADVGPTIKAILAKQFAALRDGDRFFYLNESFTSQEVSLIQQAPTLAKVIESNTAITNLQNNVFYMRLSISGTVFLDDDGSGRIEKGEPGVQGVTVNLVDDSGAVVATTVTDKNGKYSFTDQTGIPGTGNYTVSIDVPSGFQLTTTPPSTIHLSRGALTFSGVNFGLEQSIAGANAITPISPPASGSLGGKDSSTPNSVLVGVLLPGPAKQTTSATSQVWQSAGQPGSADSPRTTKGDTSSGLNQATNEFRPFSQVPPSIELTDGEFLADLLAQRQSQVLP
jgi:hypothetical protein